MYNKIYVISLIVVITTFLFAQQREWYPPWPPSSMADEWNFVENERDGLTITLHFPYGAVDRTLILILDPNYAPEGGYAIYPNGVTRDFKKGEIDYFWEYCGAKEAVERYKKVQNNK